MKNYIKPQKINFTTILVCILIISCIIAGLTIARYQEGLKKVTTISSANWLFKLTYNNTEITTEDYTINLKDTITNQSENVQADYIAPGVAGTIPLKIDCTECEVGVKYTITATDPNNTLPGQLKLYKSADYSDQSLISLGTSYTDYIEINELSTVKDCTIYWKWIPQDESSINQDDISKSGTEMSVNITISGEQLIKASNET